MNNRKNILSVFVAFILVCAVLFSSAYILLNQEHDCSGIDCPVCMELGMAEQTISGLEPAPVIEACLIILCVFPQAYMCFFGNNDVSDTLITLKVELLN